MSGTKDWHAVAENDLHTTSDEGDGDHIDFDILKVTDDERSSGHSFSDSEIESSFGEEEPVNNNTQENVMESAFAKPAGDIQSEEEEIEKPINFDAEDDLENVEETEQEKWQRTNDYMKDMQKASRERPHVTVQENQRYMKILMVGENGLGKEAFIKNTFASYCQDDDLPVNVCDPSTTIHDFRHSPEDFCTEVVVDVDEGRTKIHYNMQDTPGTHQPGADQAIMSYVCNQNREYMAKEEDSRRVVPLSSLPDPRVDIALYFLSPFFLKPQDIVIMTNLSRFVPVIPIIAKADALTAEELRKYREEITEELKIASEKAKRQIMHTFAPEELFQAGITRQVPPFAIITSNEIDPELGRHWFTRNFPWGKCEVMSSIHSDLPALKSLLFECCFESIKAATESRFYTARESYLTTRALSQAMSSKELPSTENLRQRGSLGDSASVNTPLSTIASNKAKKPQKGSWGWGWTLGFVTVAVLVQLLALGYYSKNMSSLKSLVDTYQAESAAEKQEMKEMLRERIYAIEHKRGWDHTTEGVKSFFYSAGINIKSASMLTASAISSSSKSASQAFGEGCVKSGNLLGNSLKMGFVKAKNGTRHTFSALPGQSKIWANKVGASFLGMKNGTSRFFQSVSKEGSYLCSFCQSFKSQSSRFFNNSSKVFLSVGQNLKKGFHSSGKGIFKGMKSTGKGFKKGFKHTGITFSKGFRSMGKNIRKSSKLLTSNSKIWAEKAWAPLSRNFSKGAKFLGSKSSEIGRKVFSEIGESAHKSAHAIRYGSEKSIESLNKLGKASLQKTQAIWHRWPSMKDSQAWIIKHNYRISRILTRAAVANIVNL